MDDEFDPIIEGFFKLAPEIQIPLQNTIDLVTQVLHVPTVLITANRNTFIEIFIASNHPKNPYKTGQHLALEKDYYCKTVVATGKELIVANAAKSERWKNSPNLEHQMIFYYGLPLFLPDQSIFGTFCILNNVEQTITPNLKQVMGKFQQSIQTYLKICAENHQLRATQQQLQVRKDRYKQLASIDFLTGIYNRWKFLELARDEVQRAHDHHYPIAVLMIDIDHFKEINDQHGHPFGDQVISLVAEKCKSELRSQDILCRYGGEEFIALLTHTSTIQARAIAERIRIAVEDIDLENDKIAVDVAISIGTASTQAYPTADLTELIQHADDALYQAKRGGKNQVY
ncbi:MAG: GGDEF domain-containing protein [Anaerolineaceae bacterium]|nr:GGDEF domain-containing protein [Anaerolineaceae bacterium]